MRHISKKSGLGGIGCISLFLGLCQLFDVLDFIAQVICGGDVTYNVAEGIGNPIDIYIADSMVDQAD